MTDIDTIHGMWTKYFELVFSRVHPELGPGTEEYTQAKGAFFAGAASATGIILKATDSSDEDTAKAVVSLLKDITKYVADGVCEKIKDLNREMDGNEHKTRTKRF
jgi:hypothetical protein